MHYQIHFRRKSLYYFITIVSPVTVLYVLSGLAFFLPSDDGEKLSFGVTILLAQIVAVSAMNDIFPASSNNLPLLLYFVSFVTLHMAIMCLESVIGEEVLKKNIAFFNCSQMKFEATIVNLLAFFRPKAEYWYYTGFLQSKDFGQRLF